MKIINRKANFNYQILEKYEAGIVLNGAEVKAVRHKHVNLANSHARVIDNEIYLINAAINPKSPPNAYNPTRSRKLLLHKRQILEIKRKIKAKKLTLVPTKLYTKARLIKVEIALAKSKRQHEKRDQIKKKDIEREIARELKG